MWQYMWRYMWQYRLGWHWQCLEQYRQHWQSKLHVAACGETPGGWDVLQQAMESRKRLLEVLHNPVLQEQHVPAATVICVCCHAAHSSMQVFVSLQGCANASSCYICMYICCSLSCLPRWWCIHLRRLIIETCRVEKCKKHRLLPAKILKQLYGL
jgi:hypothetical protein